ALGTGGAGANAAAGAAAAGAATAGAAAAGADSAADPGRRAPAPTEVRTGATAAATGTGTGASSISSAPDSDVRVAWAACWARRSGARTMIMLRPSSLGAASTLAPGATWAATWSRIFLPSSGWLISRPRNMIVILTLWPSLR